MQRHLKMPKVNNPHCLRNYHPEKAFINTQSESVADPHHFDADPYPDPAF
jgi:hypothetical protein